MKTIQEELQEKPTYYGKGRSPRELEIKRIKSLGYLYGIECQDSMDWMSGMEDNFQEDQATIDELKQTMEAFKKMNSIPYISSEDFNDYREIIRNNYYEVTKENLKAFLDGYLDSINSDLLKQFFDHYENKNK